MAAKVKISVDKLLNRFEVSPFVTIVYSNDLINQPLLKCFIRQRSLEEKAMLILLDSPQKAFHPYCDAKLMIVDHFGGAGGLSDELFSECVDTVASENASAVYVDSLTPLFALCGSVSAVKWLLGIKKHCKQLVCAVNKNCVAHVDIERLKKVSDTVLEVVESEGNLYRVKLMHKKPHAKTGVSISFSDEWLSILSDGRVKVVEKQETAVLPPEPFPSSLTFNLQLSDTEREERQKLVLPYTTAQNRESSKIYYEPDKDDDIDEEDPDDDLNI